MQEIKPFEHIDTALSTLDNGGYFFNIFTKADDGKISSAELSRVAGVFSDRQKMILYLSMAIHKMDEFAVDKVKSALTDDMVKALINYQPQNLLPSDAESKAVKGSSAILTGMPKLIESKTDFMCFIMIPVSTGKTTSMIMVPIFDNYDVYELRDELTSDKFFIAHARGTTKLPEVKIRVGGVIKEMKKKEGNKEVPQKFLEALYYTIL